MRLEPLLVSAIGTAEWDVVRDCRSVCQADGVSRGLKCMNIPVVCIRLLESRFQLNFSEVCSKVFRIYSCNQEAKKIKCLL